MYNTYIIDNNYKMVKNYSIWSLEIKSNINYVLCKFDKFKVIIFLRCC